MDKQQLSLQEKWTADVESYNRGAHVKTAVPQCEMCVHFIKGNALHCKSYAAERKPKDVMFAHRECLQFIHNNILEINITGENQSRLFGGIFGFCIGDMLGVPVEFSTRQQRDADPVNELRAYGTYHQPFGAWSDDTSLMLCLLDALTEEFYLERLKRNMIGFYRDALFTPNGVVFDIGNSTVRAIEKMIAGFPLGKCGGTSDRDNGNGALMRILPLAFKETPDSCALLKAIEDTSALTHAHPRSTIACILYTQFASSLFKGRSKMESLDSAIAFINEHCRDRYSSELKYYDAILSKKIANLSRDNIRSSGYVVDTLEAVLWAFFNTDSYREAVVTAINLGGDTDTIAALVGGLSGIHYGFSALPLNWIQNVGNKEEIAELTTRFWRSIAK